jgi:hypothetical protein
MIGVCSERCHHLARTRNDDVSQDVNVHGSAVVLWHRGPAYLSRILELQSFILWRFDWTPKTSPESAARR